MNTNQATTIESLTASVRQDPSVLALILCGSVAEGSESEDSDIDVIVVVTDERFERERQDKNYFWGTTRISPEYPVEVDGKVVPKRFLQEAWAHGTENIRNTLRTARVLCQRDPEIGELHGRHSGYSNEEKRRTSGSSTH